MPRDPVTPRTNFLRTDTRPVWRSTWRLPVAALVAMPVVAAGAQTPTPSSAAAEASGSWSHPGPAVTRQEVGIAGATLVAAGILTTVDERVARWSQRPAVQQSGAIRRAAAVLRFTGNPGVLALGGVTYGVGVVARHRATADVGLHTTAAVVGANVVTEIVKLTAGRARPYVTGDSNAYSFAFGRGLRRGDAYQAFPSGHATAAFAFAAALSAEGRHRWPHTNRVTEPLAYSVASLVALSRVYHDRHWASDVVMGAGIGFVTGRALVRFQHARPDNSVDARLLPPRTGRRRSASIPATFAWSVAF